MLTFRGVELLGVELPPLPSSAVLQHIALPGMAQLAGGCPSARRKRHPGYSLGVALVTSLPVLWPES